MYRIYYVRELTFNTEYIKWYSFFVPIPGGPRTEDGHGFYRSVNLLNAFFSGLQNGKKYRNWTDMRLLSLRRPDQLMKYEENEIEQLGVIECKSIYHLFEVISYNYKTQKYNTGEKLHACKIH